MIIFLDILYAGDKEEPMLLAPCIANAPHYKQLLHEILLEYRKGADECNDERKYT